MSKTSKKQILIDQMTLVKILFRHGYTSMAELKKKVPYSRQKLWRTIKLFKRKKLIIGFHPIIDEKQLGLKGYMLLIKRSMMPMDKQHLTGLTNGVIQKKADELDVLIDSFTYVHGSDIDFILSFYALNLLPAIKFKNAISETYGKTAQNVTLIETLTPIIKNGLQYPGKKDLETFFF